MSIVMDAAEGERRKREGMERAAEKRAELLEVARRFARSHAKLFGHSHADAVATALELHGYNPDDLGNAAGSIFKGSEWQFTGERIKSSRPQSHRNELKVWRLRA